jgi:hypothetical protein
MMGDDDVLLTKHLAMLQAARLAIVAAIGRLIGDYRPQAMQFATVALSELFADILSISEGVPEVADAINQQLAESCWRLVPVLRH